MTEIEQDGRTYVLKSEMENIIKERIGKVASRATSAEQALEEAEKRLEKAEKAMSSVDILNQQLAEMQTRLQHSEQRFDRYQSISKHGLTDPDLIEAIEWSFERAQKGKTDGDRQTLSEWLDQQVTNPENAPITIRPHLQALKMIAEADTPPQQKEAPGGIYALTNAVSRRVHSTTTADSSSSCKCRSNPCSRFSGLFGESTQRSRLLCSQ